MLPNLGEGTVSDLKAGRKKMGKTWGKFKRATGIKKPKKQQPTFQQPEAANTTFQSLQVSTDYDTNLRSLVNFYEVYNPEKVEEAKSILDAYTGREEMLFRRLEDLQINKDGTEDGRNYDRQEEEDANEETNEWCQEEEEQQQQPVPVQQQEQQQQQQQQQQQSLQNKMPPTSAFTSNATFLFNPEIPSVGGDGGGMNPFVFDNDSNDSAESENEEEEGSSSEEEEQQRSTNVIDFFDDTSGAPDSHNLLSTEPITSQEVTNHLDNIFGGDIDSPFNNQNDFKDVAEQMSDVLIYAEPERKEKVGDAFDVMGEFDVLRVEKKVITNVKKVEDTVIPPLKPPTKNPPGPPPVPPIQLHAQTNFSDSDDSDEFSSSESEESESEEEPSPEKLQKKKKKSKQLLSLASKALKGTGKIAKYTAKAATATLATSSSNSSSKDHAHNHSSNSSNNSSTPIPSKSEIIDILNNFHLQGAGSLPHSSVVLAISNSKIPPPSAFSFMWYKQPLNSTNLQLIPNLSTPTYQPNASDLNHTIHCKLKLHPHLLPSLYPMPLSDKFSQTPPLFPATSVKTRVVAALETGQMSVSSLELQASSTNSSLQLQPLPSSLPATNITVSLESSSKLKITSSHSDTPRGLILDLICSHNQPLFTIDPVNVNRMDVTPEPDSMMWYGDVGGELWQFHQMLEGVKKEGGMSQVHFTLHFNFVNSSKEARDVFFLVCRHKSNKSSWLLPWDEEGSERGSEGGGGSSPDSAQRFERRDSTGSTPIQDQEEADNGLLAQMIAMKKELDDIKAEEKKKQKRYSHLKQQLEVTEEQLEQVSEAFDELSNSKQDSEASTNAMITALEDENERLESSEKSKSKTIEGLRGDLEAAHAEIKKLQHQLSSKPAALYKADSPSPLTPSEDGAEKFKLEATTWKRKYESIQKDMKKVLKTSVNADRVKSLKMEQALMSDDLIAHKKALDHALGQLDEMRLREIQLLGTSFEYAPRPKPKSYVRVARNIVKMRKGVASKGKKVVREVGSAVRKVRNKARKSSLLKKSSSSRSSSRRSSSDSVEGGGGEAMNFNSPNGHVFSDSDESSSESDDEEVVEFEQMDGGGGGEEGGDNLKLEFEREA
ncbi:hypothetical protein TrLO_g11779 [Triparma laevis f. longispina]|uniref:Uncharacterized protein n=1 Tax=Triparma laevis f. longispina TaxID=1714387 RepID=A0A9W7ATG1_9STRA|nr:hypothetical protein TrLO_g11779 [Triparma laevis f. longispina]